MIRRVFVRVYVPKKVRELKAMLRKAGFGYRPGKGSHTFWWHAAISDRITFSGSDGDDAKPYQEAMVYDALRKLKERGE